MGSIDKAVITRFICRLCSKMDRFVIHIYGEEGERMRLAEKINVYLPITISVNDPLPKTVCVPCINRLETHHELMQQFALARQRLSEAAEDPPNDSNSIKRVPETCTTVLSQGSTSQVNPPTQE